MNDFRAFVTCQVRNLATPSSLLRIPTVFTTDIKKKGGGDDATMSWFLFLKTFYTRLLRMLSAHPLIL